MVFEAHTIVLSILKVKILQLILVSGHTGPPNHVEY